MEYLGKDHAPPLVLGAENNVQLMWYVDALFAVHPNMCGHTGGGLTMARGFPITASIKQKLNTRIKTESELVGVNDMMPIIIWTCYFLLSQGHGIIENYCCKTTRAPPSLNETGGPQAVSARGISTSGTFSLLVG